MMTIYLTFAVRRVAECIARAPVKDLTYGEPREATILLSDAYWK
jgi:hypothetical protein